MQAVASVLSSPYGWLDRHTDFYINKDTKLRPTSRGLASLRDTSVNRSLVEWAIFRRNVFDTCNHHRFTDAQQDAWVLIREAAQLGIHPRRMTRFIAERRHTTIRAAQRLINRLDMKLENSYEANMFAFEEKPPLISEDSYLSLSDDDIKAVIPLIYVECAGHGTPNCAGTVTARYGICFYCRQRYGMTVEDRSNAGYDWVNEIIRRTYRAAWAQARDRLYCERYGTISMNELDV